MNFSRILIVAGCCLVASPAAAQQSQAKQPSSPSGCTASPDLCAFFERYLHAFNTRDFDAFRATFADDITVLFDRPFPPERRDGRAAVEATFRRAFPPPGVPAAQLPPPIVPEDLRIQRYGNVAVISFLLRAPDEVARRTLVFRKSAEGWRVVHIHASSFDVPAR